MSLAMNRNGKSKGENLSCVKKYIKTPIVKQIYIASLDGALFSVKSRLHMFWKLIFFSFFSFHSYLAAASGQSLQVKCCLFFSFVALTLWNPQPQLALVGHSWTSYLK